MQTLVQVPLEDGDQSCFLAHARREILVAVEDRALVPLADADRICLGEVYLALVVERDVGRRVVHDTGAPVRTPGEVVLQAQRVADLVCRKLTQSRHRHLQQP